VAWLYGGLQGVDWSCVVFSKLPVRQWFYFVNLMRGDAVAKVVASLWLSYS